MARSTEGGWGRRREQPRSRSVAGSTPVLPKRLSRADRSSTLDVGMALELATTAPENFG